MPTLQSSYSAEVSASLNLDSIAPGQVTGLNFTVEQGKVILNWSALTVDANGDALSDLKAYRIFRKETAEGEFTLLAATEDNATITYTDTAAKDGASYIYAVAAIDTHDNEGIKSDDLAVKTIPSVPQGLLATSSETEIRLDWTSVKKEGDTKLNENLAGYNVYRSETSGSGYSKIGNVDANTVTYTDSTAVEGTTYFYVITAFDNSPE